MIKLIQRKKNEFEVNKFVNWDTSDEKLSTAPQICCFDQV